MSNIVIVYILACYAVAGAKSFLSEVKKDKNWYKHQRVLTIMGWTVIPMISMIIGPTLTAYRAFKDLGDGK